MSIESTELLAFKEKAFSGMKIRLPEECTILVQALVLTLYLVNAVSNVSWRCCPELFPKTIHDSVNVAIMILIKKVDEVSYKVQNYQRLRNGKSYYICAR